MSAPRCVEDGRTICDAAARLLCGVALEEAALAHVIGAEGEKIQRAMALSQGAAGGLPGLLRVNDSVRDVLSMVVKKNFTLVLKLESIHELIARCPVRPPVPVVEEGKFWMRTIRPIPGGIDFEGLDTELGPAPTPQLGIALPAGMVSRLRVEVLTNLFSAGATTVAWQTDGVVNLSVMIGPGGVGIFENAGSAIVASSASSDFRLITPTEEGSITLSATIEYLPNP